MERSRLLFLLLLAMCVSIYGIKSPSLNWDIIGYTGAMYYNLGLRGDELRKTTLSEVQKSTPQNVYIDLTGSSAYRINVATTPSSLEQHMPFYTIRMGYIWAVSLFSGVFSIDFAPATYWISSIFTGLSILILGFLFQSPNVLWFFCFPIILYLAGFAELASLSTPDSMAAFIALTSWLLYQEDHQWWAIGPLTLLPFVRTDFVLLALILCAASCVKRRYVQGVLTFLFPSLVLIWVNKVNLNYGYLKIFNFTLINIDPNPATMTIQTSIAPYFNAYLSGFKYFFGHRHFAIFCIYGLIWLKYIRHLNNSKTNQQFFVVTSFVVLHMLLFPAYYPRFFSWCAAIAGLQLMSWILNSFQKTNNN